MKVEYFSYIINLLLIICGFFITYFGWKRDKAKGRNTKVIKRKIQSRIILFTVLITILNIINNTIVFIGVDENNNDLRVIAGRTVDLETNEVLSHVRILFNKETNHILSDDRGNFVIELNDFDKDKMIILRAEKRGFKPKEILVNFPRNDLVIQMQKEK